MTFRRNLVLAALGCAALSGVSAFADLTVTSTTQVGGRTWTTSQYITATKVRSTGGEQETILDVATGGIILIDNRRKDYYKGTMADLAAQMQQMDAQMQKMGGMGAMFGGPAGEVTVTKVDGTRKIAGYDCEHYNLSMGPDMSFDLWVAPSLQAPQQYYDAAKAAYSAMGPMAARFQKMSEAMAKIKGFPLSTATHVKVMTTKVDSLQEATDVNTGPVPANAFDIPAGYTPRASPFGMRPH